MGDNLFESWSIQSSTITADPALIIEHVSSTPWSKARLLQLGPSGSTKPRLSNFLTNSKITSSHGVYISVAYSKLEYLFRYQLRIPTLSYASQHVPFCWMRPICLLSQPILQFGIEWGILSLLGSLPVLSCVYRCRTLQYLPWLEVWTLFLTPLSHRAWTTLGSLFSSCNFGL